MVPACGVSAAAHLWRPLSIRRVPATAAAAASARAGKKIARTGNREGKGTAVRVGERDWGGGVLFVVWEDKLEAWVARW